MNDLSSPQAIGARLKMLREAKELTQDQLAERLVMKRVRLAKIETGRVELKVTDIENFANTFGVTADFIIGRANANSIDADIYIACDQTHLDKKTIERISNAVRGLSGKIFEKMLKNALEVSEEFEKDC